MMKDYENGPKEIKSVTTFVNIYHFQCFRKYDDALDARVRERARFRQTYVQRYGRKEQMQYPISLSRLPKFAEWLQEEVGKAMQTDDKPTNDVFQASKLPERMATGYRAMYAHGMHLRI